MVTAVAESKFHVDVVGVSNAIIRSVSLQVSDSTNTKIRSSSSSTTLSGKLYRAAIYF